MREINRSAIVPYTPEQMFALVSDVEAYPRFVPGCKASCFRSRSETEFVASLTMAIGSVSSTFTTRNRLDPPRTMDIELVDGPFRTLRGRWSFEGLGDKGSRIALQLSFQFSNPAKDWLLGAIFESTCNSMVQAFVTRAGKVYG